MTFREGDLLVALPTVPWCDDLAGGLLVALGSDDCDLHVVWLATGVHGYFELETARMCFGIVGNGMDMAMFDEGVSP